MFRGLLGVRISIVDGPQGNFVNFTYLVILFILRYVLQMFPELFFRKLSKGKRVSTSDDESRDGSVKECNIKYFLYRGLKNATQSSSRQGQAKVAFGAKCTRAVPKYDGLSMKETA